MYAYTITKRDLVPYDHLVIQLNYKPHYQVWYASQANYTGQCVICAGHISPGEKEYRPYIGANVRHRICKLHTRKEAK